VSHKGHNAESQHVLY